MLSFSCSGPSSSFASSASAIRPRDVCAQAADRHPGPAAVVLAALHAAADAVVRALLRAHGRPSCTLPSARPRRRRRRPTTAATATTPRDSHDGREGHDAHDAHDGLDSEGVVVKVEDEGTWTAAQAEIQARVHAQTQTQTPGPAERPAEGSKLDARVAESINRGIADLTEMAPCHHFAVKALNILRHLAKKWNIDVDIAASKAARAADGADDDDQPRRAAPHGQPQLLLPQRHVRRFHLHLGRRRRRSPAPQQPCHVRQPSPPRPPAAADAIVKAATAVENPLFWPFPMQGRPMLPSGSCSRRPGLRFYSLPAPQTCLNTLTQPLRFQTHLNTHTTTLPAAKLPSTHTAQPPILSVLGYSIRSIRARHSTAHHSTRQHGGQQKDFGRQEKQNKALDLMLLFIYILPADIRVHRWVDGGDTRVSGPVRYTQRNLGQECRQHYVSNVTPVPDDPGMSLPVGWMGQ